MTVSDSSHSNNQPAGRSRFRRVLLPYIILVLGLCFTFLVSFYFSRMADAQDQSRFRNSVQAVDERIRSRIQTSIALLRAGTGLFAASESVSPVEFEKFVSQIQLNRNYPGIQGIGFSQKFSAGQKDAVIASLRRAGHPDFKIWPEEPPRDEYHGIIYLQPDDLRNRAALGYDMFTESIRRRAMETARDTGSPTASGKVVLVQEIDAEQQSGFLIYAPVYRNNTPIDTVDQRRAALVGFVYSPFRVNDFLLPVTSEQSSDISFQIYDGTEAKPEALLFASKPSGPLDHSPHFTSTFKHDVAGQPWVITYATTPSFDVVSSRGFLPYTLAAGVFLSWLFFALTRAEVGARAAAETSAAKLQASQVALREADRRAISEYERLLKRIANLSQVLGTARDLTPIFRGLRDFTKASVPCDGFFVSLYDPLQDVRTACYGWGDNAEVDVSSLPPMPVTSTGGPNSRAVKTGRVIITDDYMLATRGHPSVIVGPDNGLRPKSSIAVPMAVMGRIIGTIEVQSYELAAYRHEHATAMTMAANLTAVAIENVRLLKRESDARETAEESNRLKDEFLATVSHELRTPLTAILGWARLLESGALDERVSRQAVDTIWRNARSQAQIIDDILDVSRIITGNLRLDLQPIEVVAVVEAAISVVRQTADAKNIKIDTELDLTPLVVSGDANRLQQVIWNLLSNAVKFTNTGGSVVVKLQRVGSSVEISVRDTGPGIKRDFLPFVFDRFRQADSTTTRQHGGLGLGLAIARHLVEIHGGKITADSVGEGHGSTFTISLPLFESSIKEPPQQEQTAPAPRQLLSGLRVLVVDDDADNLKLMTTALTSRQAMVTAVSSAGEAMEAIKNSRPDVLVSDIAMPDQDGYGLITEIRSLEGPSGPAIPAVAITAYAKEEDRTRALSSGFQIYLAKPVEVTELVSVVAKAARREF